MKAITKEQIELAIKASEKVAEILDNIQTRGEWYDEIIDLNINMSESISKSLEKLLEQSEEKED